MMATFQVDDYRPLGYVYKIFGSGTRRLAKMVLVGTVFGDVRRGSDEATSNV